MTWGLVDGLRVRSFMRAMGTAYDDAPGDGVCPSPDVGAIDVLGAGAERFSEASLGRNTFGSDHVPVRRLARPPASAADAAGKAPPAPTAESA